MFMKCKFMQRFLVYGKPSNTNNIRLASLLHRYNTDVVRNLPPIQSTQLANGLTVITQDRQSSNTCLGLYINAGARYESKEENGITHFLEHMAFKATKARSKAVLEQTMLATGARFQCFTTREITAYYVEHLSIDFHLIFNIFLDCIFNNAFEEIESQKTLMFTEIVEEEKNYNNILLNYLHLSAFQGCPLEQTVLGPSHNVHKFNRKMLRNLMLRRFSPDSMVLTAIGGIVHNEVLELSNNYLGNLKIVKRHEVEEHRYTGSDMRYRDDSLLMAHVAIAFEGPSYCHSDYNIMELAKTVVGGWDKSQLGGLNHGTRVARDASYENMCDSYKSFNITYKDTGLWGAQFMASKLSLDNMTYILQDEWLKLCTMITDEELRTAKNQLKMKLLLTFESVVKLSHRVGRSFLYRGCHLPLLESIRIIDDMNSQEVKTVCYKYLYDKCPVVAAIGPIENLTDYSRIRSGTYWLRL